MIADMAFDYQNGQVFLRDGFVPFKDANVSIASSPVLYGLSVYTVFSVNWNEAAGKGYVFRLRDHYARLVNSARIMDFNTFAPAWPYERFEKTMLELIHANNVHENVLVRATIFADALIAGTKLPMICRMCSPRMSIRWGRLCRGQASMSAFRAGFATPTTPFRRGRR